MDVVNCTGCELGLCVPSARRAPAVTVYVTPASRLVREQLVGELGAVTATQVVLAHSRESLTQTVSRYELQGRLVAGGVTVASAEVGVTLLTTTDGGLRSPVLDG